MGTGTIFRRVVGRIATGARAARRNAGRILVATIVAAILVPLALDTLFPFPFERLARPQARLVTDRHGTPLRFLIAADERWRLPVTLPELPPDLPRLVVAAEDRRFGSHPGVDPVALVRATWANLRAGRVVSGGSTIAMQLARMAAPRRRTFAAKAIEALRAVQLTLHTTRRQRLESYLSLAPYGRNVEGVAAASWFLFGRDPRSLSLGETALLLTLPRAPNALDPVKHPAAARRVRDALLDRLATQGVIAPGAATEAKRQPLPRVWRRTPFAAPHAALRAVARRPRATHLATTLDSEMQARAEDLVHRRAIVLRTLGITNASAVVVERGDRSIRAWVGSAGYFDRENLGQVDGVVAERSPGSALKPFLYALAYDRGDLVPASYLLDLPTDYGGYVAENYDDRFRGRVTAHDALVSSLNAAAVRLLAEVGVPEFLRLLRSGGLETLDPRPERSGLPLVLGAGEVRLVDLVNLYATLAEGGEHRPARLLADDPHRTGAGPDDAAPVRLLSPGASLLAARTLRELRRPDLPGSWELAAGAPRVAWKTGTSYGHRDAWAIGFSERLAIGVWVGNFDGRPRVGLSGAEHAGPLLFDLFRALDPGGSWNEPTGVRIETLEVCADSHHLPGPACPARRTIEYLPGRSKIPGCTMHSLAWVDAATGERLTGDCVADRAAKPIPTTKPIVITQYPPELVAWWRAQGQPVSAPPRWSKDCKGVPPEDPPRIVSPDARTPYRLRRDAPAEFQRLALVARGADGADRLYWYQDGTLIGAAAPGETRFAPLLPGSHRLVVVDSLGRSDALDYSVEAPAGP